MMAGVSKAFCITESLLLILSIILQILSLATPGWLITIEPTLDKYQGIFYFTSCLKSDGESICEKKSWYDDYHAKLAKLESEEWFGFSNSASVNFAYHIHVKEQVFVQVTLAITIAITLVQLIRMAKGVVYYPFLTLSTCSSLAVAGTIMLTWMSAYYIHIRYYVQMQSDSDYNGFPYCVLLYKIALLFIIITVFLCLTEFSTQQKLYLGTTGGHRRSS